MSTMFEKLFEGNRKWVDDMLMRDPAFFEKLSKGQKPPVLWIGCSDSRVPANEVTGTKPGEIFVHRNIANMVVHTDLNMLSVVDYAVNALHVTDIVVCGHYGCGGVIASLGKKQNGLVDNWLRNIKDVYRIYQRELDAIEDPDKKANRLVELNVIEQVLNLSKTSIVQNAWTKGQQLALHGLVYELSTGLLTDLRTTMTGQDDVPNYYVMDAMVAG